MKQYLDLCKRIMTEGTVRQNRTGTPTIGIQGAMMQFDLAEGFPAVTTKKLAYKIAFAEMLGFLRGYSNANQFRKLGCNVWNANANENAQWLGNHYRQGEDDLGRIYGVQARGWIGREGERVDQLRNVIDDLSKGIDNRREIVTHWNPGEMKFMALPPCHMLYQFGIQGDRLNLSMYQRSADFPLGVPFNIAGYAWLLSVIAQIVNLKPGTFTHFLHDCHIYTNQVELMEEQVERTPLELPTLDVAEWIECLEDLENNACGTEDFELVGYAHHPAIKYPFSV